MTKKHSIVKLLALLVLISLVITGGRAYLVHKEAHNQGYNYMDIHVANVQKGISASMEQLYSVRSLIVGGDGAKVELDKVSHILERIDLDPVTRLVTIAPDGIIEQIYPTEGNESMIGENMFTSEHRNPEPALEALRTGNLVVSEPFHLANGEIVVAGRLPVRLYNDDGTYENWGMVSLCISFAHMFEDHSTNVLSQNDYSYRILILDNGEFVELYNNGYADGDHSISKEFPFYNTTLRIEAVPNSGFFNFGELALFFLRAVLMLWAAGVLIELVGKKVIKLLTSTKRDDLTGLFNRSAGAKRIEKAINGSDFKTAAFIMLDMDNFKTVNDTLGHLRGDVAIRGCGAILQNLFPPKNILCRLGGDEFVIFMPFDGDMVLLNEKIENLLRAMRRDVVGDGAVVPISASIGIAIAPDHAATFAELYKKADEALYRSKKRGRNCATIYDEFDVDIAQMDNFNAAAEAEARFTEAIDKPLVLIADDDFLSREALKKLLSSQYTVKEAMDGFEALTRVDQLRNSLAAIIIDVDIPKIGVFELLETLRQQNIPEQIPIFLVTSHYEEEVSRRGYELGIMDIMRRPLSPFTILQRIKSIIELYQARKDLSATVEEQEMQIQDSLATIDALHRNTIEAIASAIEFRDVDSGLHSNRIYGMTKYILSQTAMGDGLSKEDIENIAIGAIMHDVGKIAVPDELLRKADKLTDEEFEEMKLHTIKGAALMETLAESQSHPSYQYACDIAHHHHERWDGNGYPDGLKGDEITVWSQVVSIADVYDALLSPRVYKDAISPDKAVELIKSGECGVFNPKLLECFWQVEPEIRKWYTEAQQE